MKQRSQEQDRRFKRALIWGLAISVAGHVVLFLVFNGRSLPLAPFAAAGERMGDVRAAAGGGMEAIQLRTPTEVLRPPPPIPEPTPDVTEPEPEPELTEEPVPAIGLEDAAATPGSEGPAEGPGLAQGTGQGDGGTEAEGRFRVVPPRPTYFGVPPSDKPDEVRGREVAVWVFVTAQGRVIPDSTRLDPPVRNRRYREVLREYAAEWRFEPALKDGQPVGEWFRYVLTL